MSAGGLCTILGLVTVLAASGGVTAAPRACVVRYIGNGQFRSQCVDISARCRQIRCRRGEVCALDLTERTVCLPASVRNFQNCRSESSRLAQPCPQDAGIVGFGQGCTFCTGGSPF